MKEHLRVLATAWLWKFVRLCKFWRARVSRLSAGHFGPGGSPRIYAGEERFSAPEKISISNDAL
jgi:hypothetical protein